MESDESTIREAFAKTLAVRRLSPEAKDLADMYFFETVVRIHRAGEGESFTELQPAGRDLGPAIPVADAAVASGSMDGVGAAVTTEVQAGIERQFKRVLAAKNYRPDDLAAGRAYVAAYVEFIHYVERLHEAADDRTSSAASEHEH